MSAESQPGVPGAPPIPEAVQSIPLAEVAAQTETASARVRDMQTELASDRSAETVAGELPALTREIDARLRESKKIAAQRPSLEMLQRLETDWLRLRAGLGEWGRALTSRLGRIERQLGQLDELAGTWERTRVAAAGAPTELVRRVDGVVAAARQARGAFEKQRALALTMQNRVAVQDARVADALGSIAEARGDVIDRLFVKDSPAIWSVEVRAHAPRDLLEESRVSFVTQWAGLASYAERQPARFLLHAAIFLLLAAGLYRARDPVRRQVAEGEAPAIVVEMPLAAALVLSVCFGRLIYPQAPRLLWTIVLFLALVPSVMILRRLINGNLRPVFYALVGFFFVDQIRALTAAVEILPRLLFLAEMFGALLFVAWLVRSIARGRRAAVGSARSRKIIVAAASAAGLFAAAALAANALGYVTLANLVGNAMLGSAYLAIILYALMEILDGLVVLALRVRPLAYLGLVRRHGPLVRRRARRVLQALAVVLWLFGTLNRLLLRDRLSAALGGLLEAEIGVGFLHLTLGDVLSFGLTVWAAFLVSRFTRFLLDEDVYPRVGLARGLPYAISTVLHYVILLAGFFAAVAALGFDMTKVTILAGAFSVGVGFGLQNIFNNFVSGLILLFERPVKIGDVVQIDDASGVVERIGIRASVIRTPNGSEIIVPNGKLISERLTNWTLSNRRRTIELPVAVAQGADPGRVIALLERVAAAHPLVTDVPPPEALVVKLSPDLAFELRAWTGEIEKWMQIRSELAITVSAALAAEKIAIR
ncbi:MAG TPA: mechanosensitive ion channel domain-containing protein [Candidatus Binatia bacterium]